MGAGRSPDEDGAEEAQARGREERQRGRQGQPVDGRRVDHGAAPELSARGGNARSLIAAGQAEA